MPGGGGTVTQLDVGRGYQDTPGSFLSSSFCVLQPQPVSRGTCQHSFLSLWDVHLIHGIGFCPFSLPFDFVKIFSWSPVALQRCVSFRCAAERVSRTRTRSVLDFVPMWMLTEFWIVSCARLVLAGCVCMSLPVSSFVSHPPSPSGNHRFVFYMCISFC